MTNILSEQNFKTILENYFKTIKVEYISAVLKPISENVEGFLGVHNNLCITYKLGDTTGAEIFFIKSKPLKNKLQIDICDAVKAYEKELFFYDYLLREFEKYCYDVSFAAKSYFCVPNQAIILENLMQKGFVLSDRHTSFNLSQIKICLKSLAIFHAAGLAYERTKSKELQSSYSLANEFPEIFQENFYIMLTNPSCVIMKCWNGTYKTITTIINLLPHNETYKNKFHAMFRNCKFGAIFNEKTNYVKTCGHGDLWSNNMLFKYENDIPIKCCLVDYQIYRYFYPSFDVVLAIFGNTTPSFRKQNLAALYQYYYEELGNILNNYGYDINDIMPFDHYLESIKLVLRDAMLQIISEAIANNLPTKLVNSIYNDDDPQAVEKYMFDNGSMCSKAFQTDETYRKVIIEAFEEYYEILLEYN